MSPDKANVLESVMRFQIDNMACGGCAKSVTEAIHSVDPEAAVDIDLSLKRVNVESRAEEAAIASALAAGGYPPRGSA